MVTHGSPDCAWVAGDVPHPVPPVPAAAHRRQRAGALLRAPRQEAQPRRLHAEARAHSRPVRRRTPPHAPHTPHTAHSPGLGGGTRRGWRAGRRARRWSLLLTRACDWAVGSLEGNLQNWKKDEPHRVIPLAHLREVRTTGPTSFTLAFTSGEREYKLAVDSPAVCELYTSVLRAICAKEVPMPVDDSNFPPPSLRKGFMEKAGKGGDWARRWLILGPANLLIFRDASCAQVHHPPSPSPPPVLLPSPPVSSPPPHLI
jgi:hypothetical protein